MSKTIHVNIRMPSYLVAQVDAVAVAEHRTRTGAVVALVARALDAIDAEKKAAKSG